LIGIEAFVGQQGIGLQLRQQHVGTFQVAGLPTGEMKSSRVAEGIDRSVDLGAQSALAAPDGLVCALFFSAPALCWWARTMLEPIIAYSLSASWARCANSFFHTPRLVQRLIRVCTTRKSPKPSGKSRQDIPAR
jgi:hypothetical protein